MGCVRMRLWDKEIPPPPAPQGGIATLASLEEGDGGG